MQIEGAEMDAALVADANYPQMLTRVMSHERASAQLACSVRRLVQL